MYTGLKIHSNKKKLIDVYERNLFVNIEKIPFDEMKNYAGTYVIQDTETDTYKRGSMYTAKSREFIYQYHDENFNHYIFSSFTPEELLATADSTVTEYGRLITRNMYMDDRVPAADYAYGLVATNHDVYISKTATGYDIMCPVMFGDAILDKVTENDSYKTPGAAYDWVEVNANTTFDDFEYDADVLTSFGNTDNSALSFEDMMRNTNENRVVDNKICFKPLIRKMKMPSWMFLGETRVKESCTVRVQFDINPNDTARNYCIDFYDEDFYDGFVVYTEWDAENNTVVDDSATTRISIPEDSYVNTITFYVKTPADVTPFGIGMVAVFDDGETVKELARDTVSFELNYVAAGSMNSNMDDWEMFPINDKSATFTVPANGNYVGFVWRGYDDASLYEAYSYKIITDENGIDVTNMFTEHFEGGVFESNVPLSYDDGFVTFTISLKSKADVMDPDRDPNEITPAVEFPVWFSRENNAKLKLTKTQRASVTDSTMNNVITRFDMPSFVVIDAEDGISAYIWNSDKEPDENGRFEFYTYVF